MRNRPTITIRPATWEDFVALEPNLREADRREMTAGVLLHALDCMRLTYVNSRHCWAGLADDQLGCIWGVGQNSLIYGGQGTPWLFTTPLIEQHQRVFLRVSRDVVRRMNEEFPLLENFVDERNDVAIKWLRWLGFTLDPAEPYGVLQRPFHRFHKRAP